ncbi:nitroreductase family protein [uncultured Methanobrevibacter sp.]|uniref:nitroreductase family protein n=1 Tax=uncultured Methanobrevibacter sp. TaxID=253161 RepID=UPI0025EB3A11|nr:nitroreductase family protein [uncultured Methanobrevibacter sp.]
MDLLDVMLKRRSVRKYTDEEIPREKLNKIFQAGLLAPTSRNLKPCNFLMIENKETLKKNQQIKSIWRFICKGC